MPDTNMISSDERINPQPEPEFKINYCRHSRRLIIQPKTYSPPEGWVTEADAIRHTGIDTKVFDNMMRMSFIGYIHTDCRWGQWISEKWYEFYEKVPEFATTRLFNRYVCSANYSDKRELECSIRDHCHAYTIVASDSQFAALSKLLRTAPLTPGETWFLEQIEKDRLVTKKEVSFLLEYFFGSSILMNGKYERVGIGVIQKRRDAERAKRREAELQIKAKRPLTDIELWARGRLR